MSRLYFLSIIIDNCLFISKLNIINNHEIFRKMMNIKLSLLLISVLLSTYCPAQERSGQQVLQDSPAVISATLKAGGSIRLTFFDTYAQELAFKNLSRKDTIITKHLPLSKPSLIGYNNMLIMPDSPLLRSYPILLLPGDTLQLKQGVDGAIDMLHSSGYQNFIDSLLSVPKSFLWPDGAQEELLRTVGVKKMVQSADRLFARNEALIEKLNLDGSHAGALKTVNHLIKYTSIAQLFQLRNLKTSGFTDSLYKDMYLHAKDFRSVDMINQPVIYGAMITYNAKKQNPDPGKNDVWAAVIACDQELKHTQLYRDYLTTLLANCFVNTPDEIDKANQAFRQIKDDAPALDTLYQLSAILKETFTNFKQAREKLKTFANGHYSFLIENDERAANHEKKTLENLPAVALYDFGGKQYDFRKIVMNKKYKLTVVDFWASWCIPCIGEMPALRKMEQKFNTRSVQFITVSIDEDDQIVKWITVSKREKLFPKPSQYRLGDFKNSALTRLINLRTIPRFLLIDQKGNILNEDLYRPGDPHFQLELTKYLN